MTISATTQGIKPGVCLSTAKPVNPFDGQVIYMTDVDQTAVWDGTQWTVLAPIASGRNVVINGSMRVAQRGTSTTGVTTAGYYSADRFQIASVLGTQTISQDTDAPTGSGFRNSFKLLTTTANASPSSAQAMLIAQYIEGLNSQQFLKGTSSAKQFALSFWVKSNVTGTYIAELVDSDNSRSVSLSYSITASATWEKKTIIFPADTTGVLNNDNGSSLELYLWTGAGSNFTSGTLQTTWGTTVTANRAVGQTNLAAATNNYWQITGVQLEAGAVATPFEFEDFSTTLDKCQRYYEVGTNVWMSGYGVTSAILDTRINEYVSFNVTKRSAPTVTLSSITKTNEILSGGAIWADPTVKGSSNTITGFSLFSKIGTAAGTAHFETQIGSWSAAAEL